MNVNPSTLPCLFCSKKTRRRKSRLKHYPAEKYRHFLGLQKPIDSVLRNSERKRLIPFRRGRTKKNRRRNLR